MKTTHIGLVLAVMVSAAGCGDPPDANGGPITVGTTVDARISSTDTYTVPTGGQGAGTMIPGDPYTVTLTPGQYTIRMCNRLTSTFDTYVELYGPDMSMFNTESGVMTSLSGYVHDDDSAAGLQSRLRVTVVTGGTFTLTARTYSGSAPSITSNPDNNAYSIRIDSGDSMTLDCPIAP